MIKELVLVPRALFSAMLTLMGMVVVFTEPFNDFNMAGFVGTVFFLFVVSFFWQYVVLHYRLKSMSKKARVLTILIWLIVALLVITWGLYFLATFDYSQGKAALIEDFSSKMTVYLMGGSMFIGGVCAYRTFNNHGGL